MKILAFESSCDDTAVSIIEDGWKVLSNVRHSQIEHDKYGGVVPEIAARLHSEHWKEVMQEALQTANCSMDDIDSLAVTKGPGLQTSLLTGTVAASSLSTLYEKPVIPVHHIFGHICSVVLERRMEDIKFPMLVLTVSGGHTNMYLWEGGTKVKELGHTLDDAAGEAFDKTAKMLELGYPGGAIVSKLAEKGDREAISFPVPMLGKESLDFSFSGLKAAVHRELENEHKVEDICASFETTVGKILEKKVLRALDQFPNVQSVSFVGGVSANTYLRELLAQTSKSRGKDFLTTAKFEYSTDNAAMIGAAAHIMHQENSKVGDIQYVDPEPRLSLC